MSFEYQIIPNPKNSQQVKLRLKCLHQQAEKIYLALRQQQLWTSRLMTNDSDYYYNYTLFVTSTETQLNPIITQIKSSFNTPSTITETQSNQQTKINFKNWQKQFTETLKKLNRETFIPSNSSQEINSSRLEQAIKTGQTSTIEETLLNQTKANDNNALRQLIALYSQTQQHEQIFELWKAQHQEILALPVSGRLVEQLVSAHIQYYHQSNLPKSLISAQKIAQQFLPELERLHQANRVRSLLNHALNPNETPPQTDFNENLTLNEQLNQLLEIEPNNRISELKILQQKYPKATNILLALAETYTAINNAEEALKIYQSIPDKTEEIQEQYLLLLFKQKQYQQILETLSDNNNQLSPLLSGIKGIALYYLREEKTAFQFLEKAWLQGIRNFSILLPLARLFSEQNEVTKAGEIYQIIKENTPEILTLEDYTNMAVIANSWGFGDIADDEIVTYYEKCIEIGGYQLLNFSNTVEILRERVALWKNLPDIDKLLNAYSDWLEWLATHQEINKLEDELTQIRTLSAQQKINHQQHFELLESIEPYIQLIPKLRHSLVNDYFAIAIAQIDYTIRHGQPETSFFTDLQRALFHLNPESLTEIQEYQKQQQLEAQQKGIEIITQTTQETINLSSLSLALVGGHQTTRREVINELTDKYNLKNAIEIAPSNEESINREKIKAKINHCDLIAMITGYMGHDLFQVVSQLQKDNTLKGKVLLLSCRGKSGIIREILKYSSLKLSPI
jgi:hypothetical protein